MRPGEAFNPRFEACGFHPEEVVARRLDLTDGQKWLYDRMVRWARTSDGERPNERAGEVWRSHENIARELGKCGRQVARDLAKLESVRLLAHRKRDGRKSNTYVFLFAPEFNDSDEFDQTSASAQIQGEGNFERTSMSTQTPKADAGDPNLSGHPRPVRSCLNGHPRPISRPVSNTNQKAFNQQSHTPRDSRGFGMVGKPGTVPTERAPASRKTQTRPGGAAGSTFPMGGWESPEDFEAWWAQLILKHPNKNRNGLAKSRAAELILEGTLKRAEFEAGYAALATANSVRWAEQNSRFAPNLWQMLDDHLWKHALTRVDPMPIPVRNDGYVGAEDYLRRHGMQ